MKVKLKIGGNFQMYISIRLLILFIFGTEALEIILTALTGRIIFPKKEEAQEAQTIDISAKSSGIIF